MTILRPVVLLHGLWIHAKAWQPWVDLLEAAGYTATAPGWRGEAPTVLQARADADAVADQGIMEITATYRAVLAGLPRRPIVIGHSFGGLIAQKLLAEGVADAAIAVDPAQIRGVKALPITQVRSGFPVLSRRGNTRRAVSLSKKQFRYAFGNALPEQESDELFARWTIPGPGRPLFEASAANFTKTSPAAVDTTRADRGPLLILAGGRDHTVPQVVAKAAYKRYAGSKAVTEFHVFPDRGHSLVFDHGWREIADFSVSWLSRQGL